MLDPARPEHRAALRKSLGDDWIGVLEEEAPDLRCPLPVGSEPNIRIHRSGEIDAEDSRQGVLQPVFEVAVSGRNVHNAGAILQADEIVGDDAPGIPEVSSLGHMTVKERLVVQPDELLGRERLHDRERPLGERRPDQVLGEEEQLARAVRLPMSRRRLDQRVSRPRLHA